MKKNILFIFSFLTTLLAFAQEENTESTPADADVPAVIMSTPETNKDAKTFGYMSYTEVMKAMPEYKEAQSSLEKLKSYYDDEMNRAEQEFSKKFSEYIDGYRFFPENIMLKRQKELQQLMDQSIAFKKEAQELLTKSEKEIMQPIHERLKNVLKAIGTERRYSYILNTDGNNYPFINTENGQGEDITDAVIKMLK